MYNDIRRYVTSYLRGVPENQTQLFRKNSPLQVIESSDIFERLHIDILEMQKLGIARYLLVCVDAFSEWPEVFTLHSMKSHLISRIIFEEIVCRFGAPKSILTDRSRSFLNAVVADLMKLLNIKHIKTSSYWPRTNSKAERLNQSIINTLRSYCSGTGVTDYTRHLPSVLAALRGSVNVNSTNLSPYEILFGRRMRLPYS